MVYLGRDGKRQAIYANYGIIPRINYDSLLNMGPIQNSKNPQ